MPDTVDTSTTPQVAAPVVTPEPPKPHVPVSALPEEALKARLDAAKKTGQDELLRSLGVTDSAQLKSAIDALKAAEDAKKSDAEKLASLIAGKQANETRLSEYAKTIESMWSSESAKLTPEQSSAIAAVAGDDPARRLQALNALRATWTQSQIATQQIAQAAKPPAATTAAPANAPTAIVDTSQVDHVAQWEALQKVNPIKAAAYLEKHEREIFK